MYGVLNIPKTAAIIAECWNEAEQALQHQVRHYSPSLDEEDITVAFHAKLAESLFSASDRKRIENAFARDFKSSFWRNDLEIDPARIAKGLRATVTLHKRATEKLTGGDFGLVIVRPQIHLRYSSLYITEYRRGLLTQAKLQGRSRRNSFTRNQEKVLINRLEYLAMLLYRYDDDGMRELKPFAWQIADGMSWENLKKALKEDDFSETMSSSEIINRLSLGKIGTDSNSVISKLISPVANRSLVIEISWPPGAHPGSQIRVHSKDRVANVQKARLQQ